MSDADDDILREIKSWVWSGFYGPEDVDEMVVESIEDAGDENVDKKRLRDAARSEFEKKTAAEQGWPVITDCDRLDRVFADLDGGGIIALQNAGYTLSDGLSDVAEALRYRGEDGVRGYCFYHGQDVERVIRSGVLPLAFGGMDDNPAEALEIGKVVAAAMKQAGFEVEWDGSAGSRITLLDVDWKRRLA